MLTNILYILRIYTIYRKKAHISSMHTWRFPNMGIPHPFIDHSFHEINHPAIGCHMRKPPYVDMHISYIDPKPPRNEG